jgi:hypothetical protein
VSVAPCSKLMSCHDQGSFYGTLTSGSLSATCPTSASYLQLGYSVSPRSTVVLSHQVMTR